MPYRHAHWFVLAMFPLAGLAFWNQYLGKLTTASAEYHVHGITATLWLLLLAAQSWTIHAGERRLHRALGLTSVPLFAMFLAGGVGIFLAMSRLFNTAASPFYTNYAARLAWIDIVSVAAFAFFYHEALRLRRNVHLHARYLLATALLLLPPILGRLSGFVPGLAMSGPDEFWKLGIGFHLANIVTATIAFALAWQSGRHGRPFAIAGVAVLVAGVLFHFVGGMAAWQQLFARLGDLPTGPVALATGIVGLLIGYSGWSAGRVVRPARAAT